MKHFLIALSVGVLLSMGAYAPTAAQGLPVPPGLQAMDSLKSEATQSLASILLPAQKTRISGIARSTQTELERSFGETNSTNPLTKIFTVQQLATLAQSLRSGQMPSVSEDQMAGLAQFMGNLVMKAGPTWQTHSAQVNALLSVQQRTQIEALRSVTMSKMPHFAFMGFDVVSMLGEEGPMGFLSDPGSFALLLSLPSVGK